MPTIRVELFEGRTVEQKRALAAALTEATVRTSVSSADGVDILFFDIARHDWATAGTWCDRPPAAPGLHRRPPTWRRRAARQGARRLVPSPGPGRGDQGSGADAWRAIASMIRGQRDRQRQPHAVEHQGVPRPGWRAPVSRLQASGTSGSATVDHERRDLDRPGLRAGCPTRARRRAGATPADRCRARSRPARARRRARRRPRTWPAQHLPGPQVVCQVKTTGPLPAVTRKSTAIARRSAAAGRGAGRRHDRGQRAQPLGVLMAHDLRDRAAHRRADHVRRADAQRPSARSCRGPCRRAGRAR